MVSQFGDSFMAYLYFKSFSQNLKILTAHVLLGILLLVRSKVSQEPLVQKIVINNLKCDMKFPEVSK